MSIFDALGMGFASQQVQQHYLQQMQSLLIKQNSLGGLQNGFGQAASQIYGNSFTQSGLALSGALGQAATGASKPLPREIPQAGEITGYRAWRVSNGFLTGLTSSYIWPPDEPASGEPTDHAGMGIYAFKTQAKMLNGLRNWLEGPVFGSCLMWGDMVEHEHGWRAEFAKVKSLDYFSPFIETDSPRNDSPHKLKSWLFGKAPSPTPILTALRRRYKV